MYTLQIRDTENPKLLNDLICKFLDFYREFCTVDFIIQEKTTYKTSKNFKIKGLDAWLY